MGLQCAVFGLLLKRPIKETQPSKTVETAHIETEPRDITVLSDTDLTLFHEKEKTNAEISNLENKDLIHTTQISMKETRNSNGIVKFLNTNTEYPKSKVSDDKIGRKKENCFISLTSFCQSLCSPDLLRDKRFWPILLSTAVIFLSFLVPMNFTADHAIQVGMSKYQASWLTSSVGIANAAGRVLFGFIADMSFVNRPVMLVTMLFLAGILTGVSFLLTTFTLRLIYTCLYGTLIGGYFMLLNLVLAEVFGTEKIARSFGLLLFVIGISVTVSSPVAGFLYDKTGSYDATFIVAGSELIVGGIFILISSQICNKKTVIN